MPPDTDAAPFDMGAAGGRTTVAVGNAALRAAAEVRERIVRTAAALMEVAPEDLELADGKVHVAGAPERAMPLGAVSQAATWTAGPITGHGSYNQDPVPFNAACSVGLLLPVFAQYTCHTHLCEVEIDPDTGKVTVLRYVVAQDVGKAINPEACVGQIQGAVAQGLGYALLEGQRIDDEGRVVEDRFETYRLPTALDVTAASSPSSSRDSPRPGRTARREWPKGRSSRPQPRSRRQCPTRSACRSDRFRSRRGPCSRRSERVTPPGRRANGAGATRRSRRSR